MDFDLLKLYKRVIERLCDTWVYSCDGGCYDSVAHRMSLTEGPWSFVYQPKKGFDEYRTTEVSFMIFHKDHKTMTEKFVREVIQPVMDHVHHDFDTTFSQILSKTQNHWIDEIKSTTVYDVLQFEPWTLSADKKRLKTLYTLRGSDGRISCNQYRFVLWGTDASIDDPDFVEICNVKVG